MRDGPALIALPAGAPATEAVSPSARLRRETARLAEALLQLIARVAPEGDRSLAAAVAALQSFAGSVSTAPPAPAGARPLFDPAAPAHPLDRCAARLGFSAFEVDLLVLAALPDQHESFSALLRLLHPRGEPRPTVGLAAQLFQIAPRERELVVDSLHGGPATRLGAIVLSPPDAPFYERSLLLGPGLAPLLEGLPAPWPAPFVEHHPPVVRLGLGAWLAEPPTRAAVASLRHGHDCTVLVTAADDEIACARASALAAEAGVAAVVLSAAGPLGDEQERLLALHAVARGVVPILSVPPAEAPGSALLPRCKQHPGPVLLAGRAGTAVARGPRPLLPLATLPLPAAARREVWSQLLPELSAEAPLLASRFALEPNAVAEVAAEVRALGQIEQRPVASVDVARSIRARSALKLNAGVKLIHPVATWSDLVLAPDRLGQLHEAIARLAHQARVLDDWGFLKGRIGSRGVRILLAGAPGTGKTLSAEVMASALGVELLFVDISRVVSKWIGETEKNLSEVFDCAERSHAVLLFDEADALFAKRTEISDAHDRYANLETAYLLSRLEQFDGLAVLSTNLRQHIDAAFMRRMEFVIDFEEPTASERHALWRCHVPAGAAIAADVDLRELAALYPVVGGLIRNASVAAAFLAAADGTPISRQHFVRAIRREYEKNGRAFPGYPAGVNTH
jgi:hypothetical protein